MASRRDFLKTAGLFSAGLAFNGVDILAKTRELGTSQYEISSIFGFAPPL